MNLNENDAPQLSLAEWLRKAYSEAEAGCPPPEAFLEEAALAPEERRRLDAHADRCPACAAERDLARLFAGEPKEAGVSREDLDFVVARLAAVSPVRPAGQVVPFPSAVSADRPASRRSPSRWPRPARKLAAAVILALGGGLLLRLATPPAPRLPTPVTGDLVRGGEIDPLSPVGEVAAIPSQLLWVPRTWASSYRVRLTAVDDTVLWESTVPAPPARLPADVVNGLHRAVSYTWTVEALDGAGARIAVSEPIRFRAKP